MSVSSLPEWKQLLLERKRREEEQRERREKEEEEKLASMPAWKRGIIQRRKTSLSPDPGMWLDAEPKPGSQVSVETIVPVHENPFIRTQSVWRKGKDPEAANEVEIKEKEKLCLRSQEVETSRGRDIELKIERFRDLTEGWEKEKSRDKKIPHTAAHEGCDEEPQSGSHTGSEREIPRSPKRIESTGIPPGCLEVQIPRAVFYVAEEMSEKKVSECRSGDGQDWEGDHRVERRDSWTIGKPLSRIESLREKMRERELDKQRQREARVGERCEAADICEAPAAEDRYEVRGSEIMKEWDDAACTQARPDVPESEEGDAAEQTSTGVCDVRREVGMLKTSPQLPVSVPSSQDKSREEVADECSAGVPDVHSEGSQISEDETDPLKHVELHLEHHRGQYESTEEEEEEEEDRENQSPDNSLKPTNCAPTPASSPCSPSPVNSPSISPSPSPSPKLFSIRSASGGQVKRGATITITPKKTVAPAKKKYPSVDEIEVIGGYQNLERSCLVKSKVTQKRVSWFGFFTYMEWGNFHWANRGPCPCRNGPAPCYGPCTKSMMLNKLLIIICNDKETITDWSL
uniref:Phostensin/Taperin PP1-binding domain-containing protein n=1 Tax=Fundulus heteroclitus TaxID=8078 RepID=A0A3Q2P6Q1_FUNHE